MLSVGESKEFELIDIDEDHAKALAFNMIFVVWRRRTLAGPYRRLIQLVNQVADGYPEGVGVFQVVEVDAVPPDAEARRAFVDYIVMPTIRHMSVVHEGTGFKAASVRAIMSSVVAMSRPTAKHKVLNDISEAASWHAEMQSLLGRRDPASKIERIMQTLRRLQDDQYPT